MAYKYSTLLLLSYGSVVYKNLILAILLLKNTVHYFHIFAIANIASVNIFIQVFSDAGL